MSAHRSPARNTTTAACTVDVTPEAEYGTAPACAWIRDIRPAQPAGARLPLHTAPVRS
ncbi:hypothetical protein ABZ468_23455 [Streptomyces sp. NPDC005708]|uniref:hypothetical protein n=1 Tax=Streptomyces sp. NPDC005708 TaxID=3154564 RepID=UPI0033D4547E